MERLTVIGELQAKEGSEFYYVGEAPDCSGCKVKVLCHKLKPGRTYRVTKSRKTKHACKVHEGEAEVVEYEVLPLMVNIPPDKALEGSTTNFEPQEECGRQACEKRSGCFPLALKKGDPLTVAEVSSEPVLCPENRLLKIVVLAER